jgi:hypothetical protein
MAEIAALRNAHSNLLLKYAEQLEVFATLQKHAQVLALIVQPTRRNLTLLYAEQV